MGGSGMAWVTTVAPPAARVTMRVVVMTRFTRFTRLTGTRTAWRARYFLAGLAL